MPQLDKHEGGRTEQRPPPDSAQLTGVWSLTRPYISSHVWINFSANSDRCASGARLKAAEARGCLSGPRL